MKPKTAFTITYFIEKFTSIPEIFWTTGTFTDGAKCCALGHCGARWLIATKESNALEAIFRDNKLSVSRLNDAPSTDFHQDSPKLRILAALESML